MQLHTCRYQKLRRGRLRPHFALICHKRVLKVLQSSSEQTKTGSGSLSVSRSQVLWRKVYTPRWFLSRHDSGNSHCRTITNLAQKKPKTNQDVENSHLRNPSVTCHNWTSQVHWISTKGSHSPNTFSSCFSVSRSMTPKRCFAVLWVILDKMFSHRGTFLIQISVLLSSMCHTVIFWVRFQSVFANITEMFFSFLHFHWYQYMCVSCEERETLEPTCRWNEEHWSSCWRAILSWHSSGCPSPKTSQTKLTPHDTGPSSRTMCTAACRHLVWANCALSLLFFPPLPSTPFHFLGLPVIPGCPWCLHKIAALPASQVPPFQEPPRHRWH